VDACWLGSCRGELPATEGVDCNVDQPCSAKGLCLAGRCEGAFPYSDGTPCQPGDLCSGTGACLAGACEGATPLADGTTCDDDSPCTVGDACRAGGCAGGPPRDCGSADTCMSRPMCQRSTGACISRPLPDYASCDDGTACTVGEVCGGGTCGGGSGPVVYFSEDFADNSAGWVLGPEWGIAPAKQGFTNGFAFPDPENDHSASADDGVAGVVIGGDASSDIHEYAFLESPTFNTANASGKIILGYYRWLNSNGDPYMHNRIDVWNGNQWITIWASGQFFFESNWSYMQHDITNYKNAAMRVRFGFDIKQFDFSGFSSWNLDDVLVASQACP